MPRIHPHLIIAACMTFFAARTLAAPAVPDVASLPAPLADEAADDTGASAPPAVKPKTGERKFDLDKDKVLYCVGYAHLDTQWRWDFVTTIDKYIRDTLIDNFDRIEAYPGYCFNFTGSVRYEMMKEYYPKEYERLKKYIADGRWHVSGSSVDEGDVNVPSAEAAIRQVLYGNLYFKREFGKESVDFMLPDCFGFPASMPSIWAHCGLLGFSTQKLTWGSAVGIPFKIGMWEGPDGKSVVAALDPGAYVGAVEGRVDTNEKWVQRVNENGEKYGVFADYHYYGVGDQGGAPKAEDVKNYLASVDNPDSRIHVALASSDQLYKDLTPAQKGRLPRYKGDLLLTEHSAGTLTSQSYMKRWNRKNELLADAAERVAVAADWLGGAAYPREKLERAWVRVLANQMHDILPGTSLPRAYTYSWNDEIIGLNGFAAVLRDSIGAITQAMDTRAEGVPLVVYNPLTINREDVVDAVVQFGGVSPQAVRVFDAHGEETPSQIVHRSDESIRFCFLARVPSVGLAVYDVRPAETAYTGTTPIEASEDVIQNAFYRVTIGKSGNVTSIIDRSQGDRELLARPAKLVFTFERPQNWPAWNMDWADRKQPAIDEVGGDAVIRVVERGPVRATIEIKRGARNSSFTQRLQLVAGEGGRRIVWDNEIDWQSAQCALKASFPLTASNPMATYNWGMGTIERGNNDPTKYEVPSHEWFDLTDASGDFGVTVIEDSKFGSDKPTDDELRLTLLYTPGVRNSYMDQHSQDWGRHDIKYGFYSHAGDWRNGQSEWQGRRMNQPLRAFQARPHDGPLGKSHSIASVSTPQVAIRALKMAETGDHVIVRLQELFGRAADRVVVSLAAPIEAAFEVDGQERRIGDAVLREGKLQLSMTPYSPRSFAVKLARPSAAQMAASKAPHCKPVKLALDTDAASHDTAPTDGAMDPQGRSIPAEMLPKSITTEGITFNLGSTADGDNNAMACRGQTIELPDGDEEYIYLLAAAADETKAAFVVGDETQELTIQKWTGFIGQWDDRRWDTEFGEVDHKCDGRVVAIVPGFIKRDPVAWFCTHRHDPQRGNEAYQFTYLFKYRLKRSAGATTVTLPNDEGVRIFAMTVAANANEHVRSTLPLYDDFTGRAPIEFRHEYPAAEVPVFKGVEPAAVYDADRKDSFDALDIGPPSSSDYADASSGNDVTFRVFEDQGKYRPHGRSGAVDGTLPRLNDGDVAANDDDVMRCVWFDAEGRFYLDLHKSVSIDGVNTYSWHRSDRAPQVFSLWGSDAETLPNPAFTHIAHEGWTLLAVVNTKALGEGGVHGTSIRGREGSLGHFRYLMFVAENMGQGTFFTEIDVHATP